DFSQHQALRLNLPQAGRPRPLHPHLRRQQTTRIQGHALQPGSLLGQARERLYPSQRHSGGASDTRHRTRRQE
ncbi:hypothetical protein PENTCL1PPCAC_10602, partial [Pristionchus entomophagus]